MRLVPVVLAAALLAACAAPPDVASPASAVPSGVGALAPVFRDYPIGTHRSDGTACEPSAGAALRYVESLEYAGGPVVVFGLDAGGCVREIRAAAGTGQYEHAVALVTQRLGAADGEDRITCAATGVPIECRYWQRPEGRLEVVRSGATGAPAFVLRASDAPFSYPWLCDGGASR